MRDKADEMNKFRKLMELGAITLDEYRSKLFDPDFLDPSIPIDPIPQPGEEGYGRVVMDKLLDVKIINTWMYCVKCRQKKYTEQGEIVQMKNGKSAIKARCPECNTGMYKTGQA